MIITHDVLDFPVQLPLPRPTTSLPPDIRHGTPQNIICGTPYLFPPITSMTWTSDMGDHQWKPVQSYLFEDPSLFYPWVMYLLTVRITEAFDLPEPSLFYDFKVLLFFWCLRVN